MAQIEFITLLISLVLLQGTWCYDNATQYGPIIEHMKARVDPEVMPIPHGETGPLKVSITMNLINLLEVDQENNEVEVVVWEALNWQTPVLAWDPAKYNNVTQFRLRSKNIWLPDLTLYNNVRKPEVITPDIVVVSSDGTVTYVPGKRLRFSCDLQTVDSPSGANCTMKYGPWSYSARTLTITGPVEDGDNFDLSVYTGHPRYSILKTYSRKDSMKYDCCPDNYEHFKFIMTIRDGGH